MSPALKSMNKALNLVLNSFNAIQSASASAVDTAAFEEARKEAASAAVAINQMENEIREAANQQDKFSDKVNESENAMVGLVRKAAGLVAAYASAQTLLSAVNLSDQMTQTTSRMNMIVDDGGSVEELEQKIFASANRSRASYLETASAVTALAQRAGDAFTGNDEVIAFTETLNKMYVIAGASAQEQASSMLQLTQALGSGVLRGEEFNAVFEAAPNIMQSVADYMKVPIGQLRNMAAEGMITAEIVKNAVLSAADGPGGVNEQFKNMDMTWAQVANGFKNHALQAFDPVLAKISELANNPQVQAFAIGLGQAMANVANIILGIFSLVAAVGGFLYDNWGILGPIIYGVAAALVAYYSAMLIYNTIQAISNGLKAAAAMRETIHAAALAMSTGATFAATAAQHGFNAALLACPITWILLIIIAVIAAIYAVIGVINKLTGSTISATGVIVGALLSAVAFIWNLFLGLVDLVLGIVNYWYNIFGAFVNFFGNVFNDPIGSIIQLFGNLADNILGVLESIARAMDKIFGSSMADTVAGWRGTLASKVEIATKEYGNGAYEEVMGELNLSSESLGLKRWAYEDAYNTGYDFGASVDDKISSFSLDNILSSGTDTLSQYGVDDIGAGVNDIADYTGAMSDNLEITEEDLKYLRDIAEQEAINRFTTAEIKVDMGGINNNVSSNVDLDGMVTYLEEKLYETMEIAAEGVH